MPSEININIDDGVVILGRRGCMPKDGIVYTPNGIRYVEGLKEGDEIFGGKINGLYEFEDDIYEIKIENITFKANGEHPIWIRKHQCKHEQAIETWIKVEDIYQHYITKKSKETRWYANFAHAKEFPMNTISVGKPFAKLLGYLMSDGTWSEEQSVKFTNVRREILEEVIDLASQYSAEMNYNIKSYYKGNGQDLLFVGIHGNSKSVIKDKLRELGIINRDTFGKLQMLQEDELIEFINGFFDGDGTLDISHRFVSGNIKPQISFYIGIHERMAKEFQFMLWRLGVKSNITHRKKGKSSYKGCWEVRVCEYDSVKKLLSILSPIKYSERIIEAKNAIEKELRPYASHQVDKNGIWLPITSIKKIGKGVVVGWETKPSHLIISQMGLRTHNSGKTTLLKFLVTQLSSQYKIVVFDLLGNLGELAKLENVAYYKTTVGDTNKIDEVLYKVLKKGNMMIAMDEADRYKYTKTMSDYINLGRNYSCGFIVIAHRTADIHKDYLANARYIFVFRHRLPQDLEVITDWLDVDWEEVQNLADHEFLIFQDGVKIFRGSL
jgi:intein/homing endonuclease